VVVRVDMVRVEPLDEERGPAHPRAGEVRFHGDRRDAEDVERGSNVDSDAQNASSTRVGVMSDDDQSSGRDPRSSSASLALSTDSSVSHTPDASDAEDVERGSTVDSDAPPPADALDPTADEDRARAARPRSSSVWAFPPSAKHAGGRNAPNVLPVVRPVTEAELAHYEEVMEILKSRWSGIPAEAKVKMATVNDDSVQREESFNEFKALWACHANSDGTLTREQFCVFNHKHLSNIKARLGWAPDLTKVDSEHIWEAIHALHPDISGISLADYSRYHAVMKNYIN